MEVVGGNTLLPGDPRLIDHIVCELKSQGIFDQFRKECIADVDTKPAYQNLRQRVEGSVTGFLKTQNWRPDMNKNQLREMLRKNIYESGFLETGVERIVDQVVNPKINTVFLPQVEEVVYKFLGLAKPTRNSTYNPSNGPLSINTVDLLPTDLDPISPDSEVLDKSLNKSSEKTNDMETEVDAAANLDDSKNDEFESPPFEPINEQTVYEAHDDSSNDSRISGISGLTSHDSNMSDAAIAEKSIFDVNNQDSQLSKVSSNSRLSIVTTDSKHTPEKMDISDDNTEDCPSKIEENATNIPVVKEEIRDELEEIRMEINGHIQNKVTTVTEIQEVKTEVTEEITNNDVKITVEESVIEKQEVIVKEEISGNCGKDEITDNSDKKEEITNNSGVIEDNPIKEEILTKEEIEPESKKTDRHRHDSEKRKHSDKDRKDEKKSDKDKKDKDKYKSSSSSSRDKDKHREKSRDNKSGKDKDGKSRDERDKSRDNKNKDDKNKEEKDKSKSSSSTSKHSSRDRNRSSSKSESKSSKDSRDPSKSKDSKSSSSKKSDSSKSRSRDHSKSDSSKHTSKDRKSSSNSSKDYRDKKDGKKSSKREPDDHSSSRDKKTDSRRSADRDSNDGSSGVNNTSSAAKEKDSSTSASSNKSKSDNSDFSGSNSGDSGGQSDNHHFQNNQETLKVDITLDEVALNPSPPQTTLIKMKKPKIASNIFEVRKLMKIRKKMEKMEKKRQRQHELAAENKNMRSNTQSPNSIDDTDSVDSESLPNAPHNIDELVKNIASITGEDIGEPDDATITNSTAIVSKESWDAIEAKLSQSAHENVDFNLYAEDTGDSSSNSKLDDSSLKRSKRLSEEEDCLYFSNEVSPTTERFLQSIETFQKNSLLDTALLQSKRPKKLNNVHHEDPENIYFEGKKKTVKGKKRKLDGEDKIDTENNNKKVIGEMNDVLDTLTASPSGSNLSNGSIDAPIKPKSRAKKTKKTVNSPSSDADSENLSETRRYSRASILKNQRYSSDDLYKPRPVVSGTSRRQRGLLNNTDKKN